MNFKNKFSVIILILFSVSFFSCKKDNTITTPVLAEFASPTLVGKYFVKNDPNSVFKIPVGVTTISNQPRTVTFTVTSPTGAVEGQQYTLGTTSIIIPAGTAVDSISLKGIFAGYPIGRKDTLIFQITGGDPAILKAASVYKVVLQPYCDVLESQITGDYTNTIDYYSGSPSAQGPYTAQITNWVSTGPTSATANIINLGFTSDNGWGPFDPTAPASSPGINVTFDWADPSAFHVLIAKQPYFNDGSGVSTIAALNGTFSSCSNIITIPFTVVYAGNGSSYVTTTVLKR